jgi:CRISPR-associated protein Csd1
VFWADAFGVAEPEREAAAEAAEDWFGALADPPALERDADSSLEKDAGQAAKVHDLLRNVAEGRPLRLRDLDPRLKPGTRFHVLGLSPNVARLSVRYWLDDDFEVFAKRLAEHHTDLAIQPPPWKSPPSVNYLLVQTTALQRDYKNIPPLLAGEVMRAILSGAPYPRTLLSAAIIRLRAGDNPGSGWHAAVIKACLNRSEKEKLPVALEPNRKDTPYQLGRLFYVLESAQYAALGKVNATIGDRYYAAASATPARVFGPLLRGLKTHISDARKRGRGGWIEPKVAEIIAMLPPEMPRALKLEEQGRFAIGYYHERATRPSKSGDGEDEKQSNESEAK